MQLSGYKHTVYGSGNKQHSHPTPFFINSTSCLLGGLNLANTLMFVVSLSKGLNIDLGLCSRFYGLFILFFALPSTSNKPGIFLFI